MNDLYTVSRVTTTGIKTDIGTAANIREASDMVTKDLMEHPDCAHIIHKESQDG